MKLKQNTLVDIIDEQTRRALWEVKNVIDCVPDDLWDRLYCDMPCGISIQEITASKSLLFMRKI